MIETKDQIIKYFQTGFKKIKNFKIGVEHEKFLFDNIENHLKETKLMKGSVVKQGQIIGIVGKTGNVNATQLHFEIRRGKVAVDPLNYLS